LYRVGWDTEPVWTQRLEEKSSASVGDRTPSVHSVADGHLHAAGNTKKYKTLILVIALYGVEAWPHIPREEHRLKVTEDIVIFGPEKRGNNRDGENSSTVKFILSCLR
jgi:hypothetical protein